jgi:hypothetical protein
MTNPKAPIRRFDVFAEYTKQKAMQDGMPEDEAEGYGLWVAKVVASRRYGGAPITQPPRKADDKKDDKAEEAREQPAKPKWHDLGGEPQTDQLFEREIVGRMGRQFYNTVFAPAIEDAIAAGKSYQAIRDTIRKEWKP